MAVFACFLFFLMISKFKSIGLPLNSISMESIIDKNKILPFINVKWTLWTNLWLKVTDFSKIIKKTLPHQLHYSVFPQCPVFRLSLFCHMETAPPMNIVNIWSSIKKGNQGYFRFGHFWLKLNFLMHYLHDTSKNTIKVSK